VVLSQAPCSPRRWRQRGLSLAELLVATAIGTALLATLGAVARQTALARAPLRDVNEALYQGRFALQRLTLAAKATAPKALLPAAANTSGSWFGTVYFCVNAAKALVESTSTDTGCTGTQVIADNVSAFSVVAPAAAGGLDAQAADLSLTLSGPNGAGTLTLNERVRLGGGTK